MSVGVMNNKPSHNMGFLKSIVGDDRDKFSQIDEVSEDDTTTKTSLSRPGSSLSFSDRASETPPPRLSLARDGNTPESSSKYSGSGPQEDSEPDSPIDDKYVFTKSSSAPLKVNINMKDTKNKENKEAQGEKEHGARSLPKRRGSARRRPRSGHPAPGHHIQREEYVLNPAIKDLGAYKLEQKYLELRSLLQGVRPDGTSNLARTATRMARKYHQLAVGTRDGQRRRTTSDSQDSRYDGIDETTYDFSPRSSAMIEKLGINGLVYSPRRPASGKDSSIIYSPQSENDSDSYILIDGTGNQVRTRRVMLRKPTDKPTRVSSANTYFSPSRLAQERPSRPLTRRPPTGKKKNAWGSRNTSNASSQKARKKKSRSRSRSKSRSRSRSKSSSSNSSSSSSSRSRSRSKHKKGNKNKASGDYSDVFDSSSSESSRSRSRSRSKSRPVDLHLKYTKNEKLLEWLKTKDKMHREKKKKERKEKKERRKEKQLEMEKKEELKEKSDKAYNKWRKKKESEKRMLRRKQLSNGSVTKENEATEENVVIYETLDLKEYGARIDPERVPKGSQEKNPLRLSHEEWLKKKESEPIKPSPPKGKKDKHKSKAKRINNNPRIPYDQWLKAKREEDKKKKENSQANEANSQSSEAKSQEKTLSEEEKKEEAEKNKKAYQKWLASKGYEAAEENGYPKKKDIDPNLETKSAPVKKEAGEKARSQKDTNAENKGTEEPSNNPSSQSKTRAKSAKTRRQPQDAEQNKANIPMPRASSEIPEKSKTNQDARPDIPQTAAYKAVKREQKSWEEFGDYVWKESTRIVEGSENGDLKDSEGKTSTKAADGESSSKPPSESTENPTASKKVEENNPQTRETEQEAVNESNDQSTQQNDEGKPSVVKTDETPSDTTEKVKQDPTDSSDIPAIKKVTFDENLPKKVEDSESVINEKDFKDNEIGEDNSEKSNSEKNGTQITENDYSNNEKEDDELFESNLPLSVKDDKIALSKQESVKEKDTNE